MAEQKKRKNSSKGESGEEEDDLEFDKLSEKDMLKIMKLMEKIQEQELQLDQQGEFLIGKIEELKALKKQHEKLNNSYNSSIGKCEKLEKRCACATDVSSCVAPLDEENKNLKAQLEVLTKKHVKVQKEHEKLQGAHVMLQVSHEVVVTSAKHFQPPTHKCTCSLKSLDCNCANPCCSQSQQPSVEQVHVDSCDDFIAQESGELKLEIKRLEM